MSLTKTKIRHLRSTNATAIVAVVAEPMLMRLSLGRRTMFAGVTQSAHLYTDSALAC